MTEHEPAMDAYGERIGRELHGLSARALHPIDAVAVAHQVAAAHPRAARPLGLGGVVPRSVPRALVIVVLLSAVLIVALVGSALVVGGLFSTPVATPAPVARDIVFAHADYDPTRSERPGDLAIFTVSADSPGPTRLGSVPGTVPWPVQGLVGPVAVPSPDGTRMAFRLFNDQAGIWLMDRDGSDLHRLVDLPLDRLPRLPFLEAIDWSPDSTRIAYTYPYDTYGSSRSPLYVVDVDDGRVTNLGCQASSAIPTGLDPCYVLGATRALAWSPDGSRLAFARTESDRQDGLFVMNADGTGEVRLTGDLMGHLRALTWAPDGKRIAFIWESYPGENGPVTTLKVIDADGNGLRDIKRLWVGDGCCFLASTDLRPLEWSPDGDRIALVLPNKGLDQAEGELETIMLIRADGSGQSELTKGSFFDMSPDGSRFVVAQARLDEDPGPYSIYVMDIDGTEKEWMAEGEFPVWAPTPRE